MPQTFHVIRCVACKQFQNHIVKKSSNKWTCKLCSTKQSLQQIFGEGPASTCRLIVQKLNFACGEAEKEIELQKALQFQTREAQSQFYEYRDRENPPDFSEQEYFQASSTENLNKEEANFCGNLRVVPKSRSKWAKYSEVDEEGQP